MAIEYRVNRNEDRNRLFVKITTIVFLIALPFVTSVSSADSEIRNRVAQLERQITELCVLLPGNANCSGFSEAKCESDEGDKCECGRGKVCESTETTCGCFKPAEESNRSGRQVFGGLIATTPLPPQLATIDVKCGSDTYTLSTGNDSGNCSTTPPGDGGGGGGSCSDGSGNGASANCDTGCSSSSGAGSCTGP